MEIFGEKRTVREEKRERIENILRATIWCDDFKKDNVRSGSTIFDLFLVSREDTDANTIFASLFFVF